MINSVTTSGGARGYENMLSDIGDFIFINDAPAPADIIFIPGGSNPEPSERAAELWREGCAPYIMPAGKYSVKLGRFAGVKGDKYHGEYETEWAFMREVLVSNGVPADKVLKEAESTYTMENAVFSRRAADSLGLSISRAIICCKAFHARRCLMYYLSAFPETEFIVCPAETQGVRHEDWFLSEYGVKRVLGELARCGNQFTELLRP